MSIFKRLEQSSRPSNVLSELTTELVDLNSVSKVTQGGNEGIKHESGVFPFRFF